MGNGTAQNEAARLKANDLVDRHSCIGMQQLINRQTQAARVGKKRGDIAEHDPLMGKIRDGADIVFHGFHKTVLF